MVSNVYVRTVSALTSAAPSASPRIGATAPALVGLLLATASEPAPRGEPMKLSASAGASSVVSLNTPSFTNPRRKGHPEQCERPCLDRHYCAARVWPATVAV